MNLYQPPNVQDINCNIVFCCLMRGEFTIQYYIVYVSIVKSNINDSLLRMVIAGE